LACQRGVVQQGGGQQQAVGIDASAAAIADGFTGLNAGISGVYQALIVYDGGCLQVKRAGGDVGLAGIADTVRLYAGAAASAQAGLVIQLASSAEREVSPAWMAACTVRSCWVLSVRSCPATNWPVLPSCRAWMARL
jgi:hypothetical protein